MIDFKAFLSHNYRSTNVNLFFYELFSEIAAPQFEVDLGTGPMNVTRIERMMRDSNAFIGIYPSSKDPKDSSSPEELQQECKYFRLECELAERSGRPCLIFLDRRFSPYFKNPPHVRKEIFDIQEIGLSSNSPGKLRFKRVFAEFCEEVEKQMIFESLRASPTTEMKVGILLPKGNEEKNYSSEDLREIHASLEEIGLTDIVSYPWPPLIHRGDLSNITTLDWAIIDIGDESMSTGIPGYLHGRFIPCIRLSKKKAAEAKTLDPESSLFGKIEAGYPKDVLFWSDHRLLRDGISHRLSRITSPVDRINSLTSATQYFRRASLRPEPIFISYSGNDRDLAALLAKELKKHFKTVFDYKDGVSITPGEPWLKEIFDQLSGATLGIPLLSSSYFASGNCLHEAQEMVAKKDAGELFILPIKLYKDDKFNLPTWIRNNQYMHHYNHESEIDLVGEIVNFLNRSLENKKSNSLS